MFIKVIYTAYFSTCIAGLWKLLTALKLSVVTSCGSCAATRIGCGSNLGLKITVCFYNNIFSYKLVIGKYGYIITIVLALV